MTKRLAILALALLATLALVLRVRDVGAYRK